MIATFATSQNWKKNSWCTPAILFNNLSHFFDIEIEKVVKKDVFV
jgi:hypothetical protein